jgi:hypothetical protein
VWRFVLLCSVLLSLLCVGCSQSGTVEGVVEYKSRSGMMERSAYSIVRDGPSEGVQPIVVYDENLKGYFPSEGDLVISDSLEKQIEEAGYTNLDYIISVRVLSGGKLSKYTSGFYTSREIFNEAKLGTEIKFEKSPSKMGPEIVRLLE